MAEEKSSSLGIKLPGDFSSKNTETTNPVSGSGDVGVKKSSGVEPVEGPVGVDIGTSRIVEYHKDGMKFAKQTQLNAFYSVPYTKLTQGSLEKNNVPFVREDDKLLVIGNSASDFANVANDVVGRPMATGILNPDESRGPLIMDTIIKSLVKRPQSLGERLCFSVPAPERGAALNTVFHEGMVASSFVNMGFMAKGVTEGLLVAISELQEDNYTGIGISCGAGLCNVCFSYFAVPIISFSISKAGDYIDSSTAAAVQENTNRIRVIKEGSLNLVNAPKDRVEKALHIYHEEVIRALIQNLKEAMQEFEDMPKIDKAIPIVLSGGTASPEGFRDKFNDLLEESEFPVPISEVRMSEDPFNTIAKGAYLAACGLEEEE
jgi:hypothetical protein